MKDYKTTDWLLSFGDLLTILLCFFIVIISNSDLSNTKKNSGQTKSSDAQDHGITFAKLSNGDVGFLIDVESEKIENSFESVVLDLDEKLEKYINSGRYIKSKLEIISCAAPKDGDDSSSWMMAMNRGLQIMRHLNDKGVSKESIEVQVLGPYCKRLRRADMKVALRIQSVIEEKING